MFLGGRIRKHRGLKPVAELQVALVRFSDFGGKRGWDRWGWGGGESVTIVVGADSVGVDTHGFRVCRCVSVARVWGLAKRCGIRELEGSWKSELPIAAGWMAGHEAETADRGAAAYFGSGGGVGAAA